MVLVMEAICLRGKREEFFAGAVDSDFLELAFGRLGF